jgi:hypothetical protein
MTGLAPDAIPHVAMATFTWMMLSGLALSDFADLLTLSSSRSFVSSGKDLILVMICFLSLLFLFSVL